MTNLAQRTITAVIGIPIVGALTYLGGWVFVGLVAFVLWIAQYEFYKLQGDLMDVRHIVAGLVLGALVVVAQYDVPVLADVAVVALIVFLMVDAFQIKNPDVWRQSAWMIAGVVYPALIFSYFVPLRTEWAGLLTDIEQMNIPLSLLIMVWVTDTFAFAFGKTLGKRPLAPVISPKKTWEGAVGGYFGAVLAMAVMKLTMLPFVSWVDVVASASIVGVGGQIGDLVQSRLKRTCGVKDSGTFLPGHGGILDRIDGLILVVPLYYLYLKGMLL